jgi:rhodanese-related sulfurtransferase
MSEQPVPLISHDDFVARLTDPTQITLNVLPAEAPLMDMHIPATGHFPLSEIEEKAATRLPDKGADIVVYCAGPT